MYDLIIYLIQRLSNWFVLRSVKVGQCIDHVSTAMLASVTSKYTNQHIMLLLSFPWKTSSQQFTSCCQKLAVETGTSSIYA